MTTGRINQVAQTRRTRSERGPAGAPEGPERSSAGHTNGDGRRERPATKADSRAGAIERPLQNINFAFPVTLTATAGGL